MRAALGSAGTRWARQAADGQLPAGPSVGSVRGRSGLPNGRTLTGGFLVAAAAVIVFGAWLQTSGNHGRGWVVARRPLAAGWTLRPGDLTTSTMRLPGTTADHAFGNPAALAGRTLAAPLAGGELLQTSDLVPTRTAASVRPVAVTVDPPEATTLSVGQLVDVLVTNGTSPSAPTEAVVYGARVLDISRSSGSLAAANSGSEVTLGVHSFAELQAVVHAARTGAISVVAGEAGDGSGTGPGAGPPASTASGTNSGAAG